VDGLMQNNYLAVVVSNTVKGVVFIDDAINLSHEELKKKFKEAVDKDEINHFEIQTRGEQ
jgi:hypothetical protein